MNSTIMNKSDTNALDQVIGVLKQKKLVILPCDTIYGIIGLAPDTYETLVSIKKRPNEKHFIHYVTFEMLARMTPMNIDDALLALWPGKVTFLVYDHQRNKISLRIPDDRFLHSILTEVGHPLYTTSVNITGKTPLTDIQQMVEKFHRSVDLFIETQDTLDEHPSTILDLTTTPYTLIRQGSVDVSSFM